MNDIAAIDEQPGRCRAGGKGGVDEKLGRVGGELCLHAAHLRQQALLAGLRHAGE